MQQSFEKMLPRWLCELEQAQARIRFTAEEAMRFTLNLARKSISEQAGGPFGAALFSSEGYLLASGINLVVSGRSFLWHAEIVALQRGCFKASSHELKTQSQTTLYSSCEPCLMCKGALLWSGVERLVYASRAEEAEALGFVEGPKIANWTEYFAEHQIRIQSEYLNSEARDILPSYRLHAGQLYGRGK